MSLEHLPDENIQHVNLAVDVMYHAVRGEADTASDNIAAAMIDAANAMIDANPRLERCVESWESGEAAKAVYAKRREESAQTRAAVEAARRAFERSMRGESTLTDDEIQSWMEGGDE